MISDERVIDLSHDDYVGSILGQEITAMAKELLAYRKAFTEPVAFTAISNVNELSRGVSYMWQPGNEKPTDVALYRKPTIPE